MYMLGVLRRDGSREAPPSLGVTDVAAELAKSVPYGKRNYKMIGWSLIFNVHNNDP